MKKLIVPILACLLFNCTVEDIKNQAGETTEIIKSLNEAVLVNKIFQDVGNNNGGAILEAEVSVSAQSKTFSKSSTGPVITVEPFDLSTFPKTTTIDYGTGVLCKDGITRKGIIKVVSTNWYRVAGSVHTATFNNYYHESYKVEGTHVVENLGEVEGNLKYTVTINDGKVTSSIGEVITYQETSTRTWIAGADTPFNIWDDEYLLEGQQTGVNTKGIDYKLAIRDPLHFTLLPRSIKSGIMDVEIGLIKNIELNYTNKTISVLGKTIPLVN